MKYKDNRLYLADNSPQVLQVDSDLNLIELINKTGQGPGEFTGVTDISVVNDSLYFYDRQQAKILVYDIDNIFIREVGLPEAGGFNMAVDHHGRIFLSTPSRTNPITMYSANGEKIQGFGNNTVGSDSFQYRRNSRFLFIHNDQLIAIAMSEPELEIYSLEGEFISKAEIAPTEIEELIERAKRENEGAGEQPVSFLSLIYHTATIYNDSIYLIEAKRPNENTNTYDSNFTYLFKYMLDPNGDINLERTFKLFHSDHEELFYGFRLTAKGDHKLMVYDLMGKSLHVFQDEHL
ncbi:MAG: 6-bladed beta-propeller [Balneolaceae bacterium]|nr:6-bladed beta-propeller [Balneolaceae bacterium]